MNDLAHGLAPKMKPISRRRSAIVCALDIGTSKIVCVDRAAEAAVAAGRAAAPHPFDRGARHRPHAGAGHEVAAAWSTSRRPKKCCATRSIRPSARQACRSIRRAARNHGRPHHERTVRRNRAHADADRDTTTTSSACSRPAAIIRCAKAAPCCTRSPSATRSTRPRGVRDPRGMIGQPARRRHACGDDGCRRGAQSHAAGRALPYRRRGDGRERLMCPGCRFWPRTRPISAPPWSTRCRHDDDCGVRRGAFRPCRWLRGRRPARHDGHRARPDHDDRGCRAR